MFRRIGINSVQERVYRALVDTPDQSVEELVAAVDLSAEHVEAELVELSQMGLVTDPTPDHRYSATDPEAAIAVLIRKEQQKLDAVRVESIRLTEQLRATRQQDNASSIVEVLTGAALTEQWQHGQRTARHRIRMTDRPPYFNAATVETMETEHERIRAGLKYQVVYDQQTFDDPTHTERVVTAVQWGEDARVLAGVPIKLVIFDDDFAMLVISRQAQTDVPTVILVRPSALLDALSALFDLLWARGVKISHVGADGQAALTKGDETVPTELLQLLAMGLKDEAIAHEQGVTVRTVRRRIADLYQQLGVHNRFQAGVAAKERGWL